MPTRRGSAENLGKVEMIGRTLTNESRRRSCDAQSAVYICIPVRGWSRGNDEFSDIPLCSISCPGESSGWIPYFRDVLARAAVERVDLCF